MLVWATKGVTQTRCWSKLCVGMGQTKRNNTPNVITKEQLGVESLQHKMPKNVDLCFGMSDQRIRHALY